MRQLTFWPEELPASLSPLPDSAKDLQTPEVTSCLPTLESLTVLGLDGLCGRMSPAFCHRTEDGILEPSLRRWSSWGMGSPTECWTLNGSEWPSVVVVCSLSDVLETQQVPPRFYLSPKACAGILRRAEKRGKELPPMLLQALRQVITQAEALNQAK